MYKLSFKQLTDIDIKLIFDFYDIPLSFIGYSQERNYYFHYINDNDFFISELSSEDIIILNEVKDVKLFFEHLLESDKIKIVKFNYELENLEYENLIDYEFDYENYTPKLNKIINYDYNSDVEINRDTDFNDFLEFPLESTKLSLRIINQFNDHILPFDIIKKAMDYVASSFAAFKIKNEGNRFFDQELMVSAFEQGSFKINFAIQSSQFDSDQTGFSPMINIIDQISKVTDDIDYDFVLNDTGEELVNSFKKFYDMIKEENLGIEFYNINSEIPHKVATVRPSQSIDINLEKLNKKISDKNMERIEKISMDVPNSKFVTGSILQNVCKILIEGDKKKAKFEKSLFDKIKKNGKPLDLNKSVNLSLILEKHFDSSDNLIKEQFIINNFDYKI